MSEQLKQLNAIQDWLGEGAMNFFGRPFAGKDNQAKQFARHFGSDVIGGGEILRSMELDSDISSAMHAGELVNSSFYLKAICPAIGAMAIAGKPLVLSAVGRVKGEETHVLTALNTIQRPLKVVVNLEIDDTEVFNRLGRRRKVVRPDDNPLSLRTRLDEYVLKTEPLLKTYDEMGLLLPIDGHGPKEVVLERIITGIIDRHIT